jgi:magnesium-transporting ATPase (P-type)
LYILFAAFITSIVLEKWTDVGLIIGVIVINVTIGLVQEGKAEKAAHAIKAMLTSNALVVRAGQRIAVEAEMLVPGDIVFIQSGDRVPADLRLIEVSGLQCLEAMLTGESLPVSKHMDTVPLSAPLGERKNMSYSATMVVKGQALGVVIGTGDRTEIGKINQMLGNVEQEKSNILKQMDIVGRWIAVVVLFVAIITLILALTMKVQAKHLPQQ